MDASVNYTHPWWQWLVGPLVAVGVVAGALVGRLGPNLHLAPQQVHVRRDANAFVLDTELHKGTVALATNEDS